MTVGRTELPNGPIYVPEDSQETMPAPEWGSFLYIVDGALNPVPVSDLDQVVLKELMVENKGLTLHDLKKRSDLGGSSCMVKNEGKGRKMTGFQRHRKIVVLLDILKASQTSTAD